MESLPELVILNSISMAKSGLNRSPYRVLKELLRIAILLTRSRTCSSVRTV